jgi:predicted O-methyltransferase YrrM
MTADGWPRVEQHLPAIMDAARRIEGWLSEKEMRFLALLAACPTAAGRMLEIGCYHGKSTVLLARVLQLIGDQPLVSVDPISPEFLHRNLCRAGVQEWVEFHRDYSSGFLPQWSEPIRLLWHDGANSRETVRDDLAMLMPYIEDAAVVAFHDVLNTSGERIHVFLEGILESPHFGPVGVCGSIGWAQYRRQIRDAAPYQAAKLRLKRKLRRIAPYHDLRLEPLGGLTKYRYKLLRWLVPHAPVRRRHWLNKWPSCHRRPPADPEPVQGRFLAGEKTGPPSRISVFPRMGDRP